MTQNAIVDKLLSGGLARVKVERLSACGKSCASCGTGCADKHVITVEADSCELPPSCCSISGNHVTLDTDYLLTLEEGVHTFTVHADGGSESYIYSIGGPAELVLPEDTQIVEQAAFSGVGAKSVRIDDACTQIGKNAFAACPDLTWVYIPNSVSQIGEGAFDDCPNLLLIFEEGGMAAEYTASMQLPYRLSKSRSAS